MGFGAHPGLLLLGKLAHPDSGPHMVTRSCCMKLNLVELIDARHNSHGTPEALRPYTRILRPLWGLRNAVARLAPRLTTGTLKRVPEATAQRVPDLVVEQEVDRKRGALK